MQGYCFSRSFNLRKNKNIFPKFKFTNCLRLSYKSLIICGICQINETTFIPLILVCIFSAGVQHASMEFIFFKKKLLASYCEASFNYHTGSTQISPCIFQNEDPYHSKLMDWFLCDRDPRHERVK